MSVIYKSVIRSIIAVFCGYILSTSSIAVAATSSIDSLPPDIYAYWSMFELETQFGCVLQSAPGIAPMGYMGHAKSLWDPDGVYADEEADYNCVRFDEEDDSLVFAWIGSTLVWREFQDMKEASFSIWVKPDSGNGTESCIATYSSSGWKVSNGDSVFVYSAEYFYLIYQSSQTPRLYAGRTGDSMNVAVSTAAIPDLMNRWHHIVVNFSVDSIAIYLDGMACPQTAGYPKRIGCQDGFRLGGRPFMEDQNSFIGYMDEMALYDRWLTDAEIVHIYSLPGLPDSVSPVGNIPPPDKAVSNTVRAASTGDGVLFTWLLPFDVTTELAIADAAGNTVRSFRLPGGKQRVAWNGRDDRSHRAVPGVYFYGIRAGGRVYRGKCILLP